jgi:ferredoxin
MATPADRIPANIPGRYYVDASCIDCDQCRAIAPQIFARDEESGLSFVTRQPQTEDEIAQVEEIISGCATGSIGNDGA